VVSVELEPGVVVGDGLAAPVEGVLTGGVEGIGAPELEVAPVLLLVDGAVALVALVAVSPGRLGEALVVALALALAVSAPAVASAPEFSPDHQFFAIRCRGEAFR